MTIDFKGFAVYKNEMLPPNTLMVSPDVFELLTETPEQRQSQYDAFTAQLNDLDRLMLARGLSPTGRTTHRQPNLADLPKGPKP